MIEWKELINNDDENRCERQFSRIRIFFNSLIINYNFIYCTVNYVDLIE